jgi:hypothetical protein
VRRFNAIKRSSSSRPVESIKDIEMRVSGINRKSKNRQTRCGLKDVDQVIAVMGHQAIIIEEDNPCVKI